MNKADRAAIIFFTDADRIRITRNGEVRAYGTVPNTNRTGWYFAGFADHILDAIHNQYA
jgi:hypothetical protein